MELYYEVAKGIFSMKDENNAQTLMNHADEAIFVNRYHTNLLKAWRRRNFPTATDVTSTQLIESELLNCSATCCLTKAIYLFPIARIPLASLGSSLYSSHSPSFSLIPSHFLSFSRGFSCVPNVS